MLKVDPDQLLAALSARLLPPPDAAQRAGISIHVLTDILGRRARRDADGLVIVEDETARKLAKLLDEVKPILSVTFESQGPRRLPDNLHVDMVTTPEDRIRNFHRAREAAKKPNSE
jgi:hypothetical protein